MNTVYHPCPHEQTGEVCVLGYESTSYDAGAAGIFSTEENSHASASTPCVTVEKGSSHLPLLIII